MLDLPPRDAALVAFHDHAAEEESFLDAVLEGLSRPERAIPCRFLYDARGSALFDEICELPEYYPTRTETRILKASAAEVADLVGPGVQLIELGSGSSIKVRILLEAFQDPAAYIAVDVSREHLRAAAADDGWPSSPAPPSATSSRRRPWPSSSSGPDVSARTPPCWWGST